MQKLVILGAAAVSLFCLSAGVSWYLRPTSHEAEKTEAAKPSAPAAESDRTAHPPTAATGTASTANSLRPAVRAPYNPEVDGALQLSANLNKQMESVKAREQALTARQKSIELAYQDIRDERTAVDELRKKLDQALADLETKVAAMEQQAGELNEERQKTNRQSDELKKSTLEFEGREQDRIRQMAGMYDAMAPASAARILQQMADTGNMDTAVKILGMMKDRQAAKVLAEFADATVAAQLLDKLKGLKRPTPVTKKQ